LNIFIRELKRNKKSFFIWTFCIIFLNFIQLAAYPSVVESTKTIKELFTQMPQGLIEAFGLDKLDMTSVLGYFGMKIYIMILLFGSIYSMLLSSLILSKEEGEKTAEFLMSKPLTRNSIVSSKLLSTLFFIMSFNILNLISNFIFIEIFRKNEYDINIYLLFCLSSLLINLTFASIGFFISVFIVKSKTIYPISIGIILGTYFLSIISSLSSKTENLKYLSPFKYVDAIDLITNKKIEGLYIIIFLIIIVSMTILSYVFYNKKDLKLS